MPIKDTNICLQGIFGIWSKGLQDKTATGRTSCKKVDNSKLWQVTMHTKDTKTSKSKQRSYIRMSQLECCSMLLLIVWYCAHRKITRPMVLLVFFLLVSFHFQSICLYCSHHERCYINSVCDNKYNAVLW